MRTAEWYFIAYQFMSKFDGYDLRLESYLDGIFNEYCLLNNGQEVGPVIRENMVNGKFDFPYGDKS